MPLLACSPYVSDPQCVQVDVIPQANELVADGQGTLLVDIAVCSCGSQALCESDLLLPGTSVDIHASLGQISPESINLPTGKGTAVLGNDQRELGVTTVTVAASDWIGTAQVDFTEQIITPSDIVISSMNSSLIADGHSSTLLQVDAINVTGNDSVRIIPDGQAIFPATTSFHSGSAQFIYTAPSAESIGISDGESQEVTLYAVVNEAHFSAPITLFLSADFEDADFAIVPNTPWMTTGSSLQFQIQGMTGSPQWNVDSNVTLSCNGGELSSCDGETEVSITLDEIECLDSSDCEFYIWVTDSQTGAQANSTVTVR